MRPSSRSSGAGSTRAWTPAATSTSTTPAPASPRPRRRDELRAERRPELRVDASLLRRYLTEVGGEHHNLFAYPAQSNFSGVQHPLAWIEQAHERGWDVLLDAAAYVPTNRLDLSRWRPDFVALSFYKMFGWPTGVGALIVRREALARLERPWFSGGTVVAAFVQREWYESAPGAAHFEDGTVNFLNLPAVEIGLRFSSGSASRRSTRASRRSPRGCSRGSTRSGIRTMRRPPPSTGPATSTGAAPRSPSTSSIRTAASSTKALRRSPRAPARHLAAHRLLLQPRRRRGRLHDLARDLVGGEFGEGMTLDDYVRVIGLPSGGAVRASLGLASNAADLDRFAAFAGEFVDRTEIPDDLPARTVC